MIDCGSLVAAARNEPALGSWDLTTGRAATTGRVLRIPAEVIRDRVRAWFPLGGHLIEGLYRTAHAMSALLACREPGGPAPSRLRGSALCRFSQAASAETRSPAAIRYFGIITYTTDGPGYEDANPASKLRGRASRTLAVSEHQA